MEVRVWQKEQSFEDFELLEPVSGTSCGVSGWTSLGFECPGEVGLVQWYGTSAYNVFVKIANGEIEKAETRHFQNWKDKEVFERTGLIAVALRMFFETLQQEFNHHVDEFRGEVAFAKQTEELDRIKRDDPESLIQNM